MRAFGAEKMNREKSPIPGDGGDGLPPQATCRAALRRRRRRRSTTSAACRISRRGTRPQARPLRDPEPPEDLDLCAAGGGDGPSLSDENDEELFSMFLDVEKLNSTCGASSEAEAESSSAGAAAVAAAPPAAHGARPKHQHSLSMDESMSIKAEELVGASPGTEGMSSAEAKKAVSAAKLAELALVDPKRAKRCHLFLH